MIRAEYLVRSDRREPVRPTRAMRHGAGVKLQILIGYGVVFAVRIFEGHSVARMDDQVCGHESFGFEDHHGRRARFSERAGVAYRSKDDREDRYFAGLRSAHETYVAISLTDLCTLIT